MFLEQSILWRNFIQNTRTHSHGQQVGYIIFDRSQVSACLKTVLLYLHRRNHNSRRSVVLSNLHENHTKKIITQNSNMCISFSYLTYLNLGLQSFYPHLTKQQLVLQFWSCFIDSLALGIFHCHQLESQTQHLTLQSFYVLPMNHQFDSGVKPLSATGKHWSGLWLLPVLLFSTTSVIWPCCHFTVSCKAIIIALMLS